MDNIAIIASAQATEADLAEARLGTRFGRLDLASQLALLAVESLGVKFDAWASGRVGICLAARAGSLSTDVEYWNGREAVGGLSPTLFAYTLPSSAIGEIAIRHRLTGPNLCFVGGDSVVLPEGADLIHRGEAEACLCVYCEVISKAAAELISRPRAAGAWAICLQGGGEGLCRLRENDRDMKSLCAKLRG